MSEQFQQWAEDAVRRALAGGDFGGLIVNLVEGEAELAGTPTYDPSDDDWACDDTGWFGKWRWDPEELGGWEGVLDALSDELAEVCVSLDRELRASTVDGVGIGYVDGDLVMAWI